MGGRVVTVNDVLDGHTALDLQCLDRIYLNAYVPKLQTSAQVVAFLSDHLGYPFPSPALFKKLGERTGTPQWWFTKADRRVTCYYFYLWDVDFGPALSRSVPISRIRRRSGHAVTSGANSKPPRQA
jgi:hypothetical protein